MSEQSKNHAIPRVKIQPEEMLAATSELNPALCLVTGCYETKGVGYWAATQVKVLNLYSEAIYCSMWGLIVSSGQNNSKRRGFMNSTRHNSYIYPVIFAVSFGIVGILIGLLVFNFISSKNLGLFISSIIAVGFIILEFIIAGYCIGALINNRVVIRKKYEDKIKQWEEEGYNIEELKRKWGFK